MGRKIFKMAEANNIFNNEAGRRLQKAPDVAFIEISEIAPSVTLAGESRIACVGWKWKLFVKPYAYGVREKYYQYLWHIFVAYVHSYVAFLYI